MAELYYRSLPAHRAWIHLWAGNSGIALGSPRTTSCRLHTLKHTYICDQSTGQALHQHSLDADWGFSLRTIICEIDSIFENDHWRQFMQSHRLQKNKISVMVSNTADWRNQPHLTSGKTSSDAEKKCVYTMSSDATSMYFSWNHTTAKWVKEVCVCVCVCMCACVSVHIHTHTHTRTLTWTHSYEISY